MRIALFAALLLIAATTKAGTLETCQAKEKNAYDIQSCTEAERTRSINRLRESDPLVLTAIRKETNGNQYRALMRAYRMAQAQHVRERQTVCAKKVAAHERIACEADMNFAHIDQLTRFTK